MKCPVCDKNIKDIETTQFCPQCGWELIVIPDNSPDELKRFFQEKEKLYKANYLAHKENAGKLTTLNRDRQTENNNNILLNREIQVLQQKKDNLQKTAKDMKGKIRIATTKKKDMEKQKQCYEQKQQEFETSNKTTQITDTDYDIFCHIIELYKLYKTQN